MTHHLPSAVRTHPRLTAAGAVVVLLAVAGGSYLALHGDSTAAAQAATTTTQTVSTGTLRQTVSATGTLAPAHDESLDFAVSGQVTQVLVKVGQYVATNQVLARIDSAALAANVAQARSSVASARARVDDDETNGVDATQLSADTAALTAAENQLASARTQRSEATLRSPIAGAVAAVNLTVGQNVSGSGASSGGSGGGGGGGGGFGGSSSSSSSSSGAQIEVISTDAWQVSASVDASSVGLIQQGDQAQLTVGGAAATVYGTVGSIGLISSSSGGTASYPVTIDVTGSPSGLHDGASVTATIIYKQLTDVITVPTLALHRSTSGATTVDKVVGGRTVSTTVTTGITSGLQVQITSGLQAGDTIVVPVLQRTAGGGGNVGPGTGRFGGTGGTGRFGGGQFGGGQFGGGGGQFPGGFTGRLNNGGNGD
ncbi:MAG: efflux RND transporter periplasmic adaptor subunit [Jatrophihabitans sp.]|uniref:efflux RND transporter periplasmic adaptor subunit n=1 Tax=Jatrophihabitans sp. TaxID=1932789 RepID=UPI003F820B1F